MFINFLIATGYLAIGYIYASALWYSEEIQAAVREKFIELDPEYLRQISKAGFIVTMLTWPLCIIGAIILNLKERIERRMG